MEFITFLAKLGTYWMSWTNLMSWRWLVTSQTSPLKYSNNSENEKHSSLGGIIHFTMFWNSVAFRLAVCNFQPGIKWCTFGVDYHLLINAIVSSLLPPSEGISHYALISSSSDFTIYLWSKDCSSIKLHFNFKNVLALLGIYKLYYCK